MPGLRPRPLNLTDSELEELNELINKHTTPQQIALRARIILLAEKGLNHRQIGKELKISRQMARRWRSRWLALAEKQIPVKERLSDAERPGAPGTFTPEQLTHLFAIACEDPQQCSRPISHWTAAELADEMKKRGIVFEYFSTTCASITC